MRVHIHDDGLRFRNGHSFDCDHAIASRLIELGHDVEVSAPHDARPDVHQGFRNLGITVRAHYTHNARADSGPDNEKAILTLAASLRETTSAEAWLFPTLTPQQVVAYSLVETVPRMLGLTHIDPGDMGRFGGQLWSNGCHRIHERKLPAVLGAIDPVVGAFTQSWSCGLPVHDLPVPLGGDVRKSPPKKARVVGFFGHQRDERGLAMLPGLVHELIGRGYEVVVHDTTARSRGDHPNLRVIPRFVDDLAGEMVRCDIVVCLMDRRYYRHRLSGIACFAAAAGIPFAVAAGGLPAVRFGRWSDAIGVYSELTVQDVTKTVDALASNYSAATARAAEMSAHWHANHGVHAFVDGFIDAMGG